jgi:isopenicillin N synthase-like dioxygenase
MIVNNIPGYVEKRKALLPLAQKLAHLPQNTLDSLETPEYNYAVGWSHGKEKFMGMPDIYKGSYYANPCFEDYKSNQIDKDGNLITFKNKWPEHELPELKPAFQTYGKFINDIGIELAKNIDSYIKARAPTYENGTLEKILRNSTKMTGRLLHYFPVDEEVANKDMKWCGWHNDHGTLTGLCSALYLDKDQNEVDPNDIEDTESGLFAMNRKYEQIKIKIPQNSLAFQIGESAQIHSGGLLKATPHCVISKPNTKGISRNTMAMFLEPNFSDVMNIPEGMDPENVHKADPTKSVPLIENRWKNGQTFEDFESETFKKYYEY